MWGGWNSALITHLVYLSFGVRYNPRYLCSFLKKLGFSYQKAKFVPVAWDEETTQLSRKKWIDERWPRIFELILKSIMTAISPSKKNDSCKY